MSDDERTLEQLESVYMGGFADEVDGDVEAPTGHFYRVGKQIVTTNSYGFREVDTYDNEDAAEEAFFNLQNEYVEWECEGEDLHEY